MKQFDNILSNNNNKTLEINTDYSQDKTNHIMKRRIEKETEKGFGFKLTKKGFKRLPTDIFQKKVLKLESINAKLEENNKEKKEKKEEKKEEKEEKTKNVLVKSKEIKKVERNEKKDKKHNENVKKTLILKKSKTTKNKKKSRISTKTKTDKTRASTVNKDKITRNISIYQSQYPSDDDILPLPLPNETYFESFKLEDYSNQKYIGNKIYYDYYDKYCFSFEASSRPIFVLGHVNLNHLISVKPKNKSKILKNSMSFRYREKATTFIYYK